MTEVRSEAQVWEIINREKKRRKGVNKELEMKEGKEYFMSLLEGVECKVESREKRSKRGRNSEGR